MAWAALFLALGQMAGALIAAYTTVVAVVVTLMQNALRLPLPAASSSS